ncbi:hypothetical protein CL622_06605 [archaeon]|nr:hypothetical protein [archaeon]|tara:strand:+ start:881 stop:1969 length:1089 start_codon:yes stop_codon:yes gene_type:complete
MKRGFQYKRGQVAMEFLMTYGWAIIIILLAIATLWLLGVFSPSVSTTCQIEAPFTCQDAVVADNSVILRLGASHAQSAKVSSVTVNGQACPRLTNTQITNNQITLVRCLGLTLDEKEKVSVEIDASYVKRGGGLTHRIEGTVSGQASKGNYVYSSDSSIIAAYDFEGDGNDVSGNSNDLTIVGADCSVAGKKGNGCLLDKSVSFEYLIANPMTSFPSTSITVEFWMWSSDTYTYSWPVSYASTATDNDFGVGDIPSIDVWVGNDRGVTSGVALGDSQWHHIAATWQSSDGALFIYKDGVEIHSDTASSGGSITGGGSLVLGQDQDSIGGTFQSAQSYDGIIDELAIYNRVLTPQEIKDHAKI